MLGGPGSGKGVQCEKIVEKYKFNHLSSGDLLRAEVQSGSPRGKELQVIMEKGELVSLEIVLALIKEAMLKLVDKSPYFLIDGYPRELEQGTQFERDWTRGFSSKKQSIGIRFTLNALGPSDLSRNPVNSTKVAPCFTVLYFEVSKEVMKQRLLKRGETSGRADDNEATIVQRLKIFDEKTVPVIDHYNKKGKVIKIDASNTIDEVFKVVVQEFDKKGIK
ncbi:hypothetical protein ACTXT7_001400 [Hymenolepis weldensis]